jgi:hypothetical protein
MDERVEELGLLGQCPRLKRICIAGKKRKEKKRKRDGGEHEGKGKERKKTSNIR